jgi:uncharacterized protein (UPF0335 family)
MLVVSDTSPLTALLQIRQSLPRVERMNTENEILAEIRHTRAEHAKECGYDIHKMFDQLRTETARLEAERWKVVTPSPRRPASSLYTNETPAPGGNP